MYISAYHLWPADMPTREVSLGPGSSLWHSSHTFELLKMKVPCSLKIMGTDYPVTEHHIHKNRALIIQIHLPMLSVAHTVHHHVVWLMNESQRMWEEAVIPWSDVNIPAFASRDRKTKKDSHMTTSHQAKIWTWSHKYTPWH